MVVSLCNHQIILTLYSFMHKINTHMAILYQTANPKFIISSYAVPFWPSCCYRSSFLYLCIVMCVSPPYTFQDDDLRSAVCVEQAAHAFLRIQPSMARKYALHLILAGHRYARVAQVGSGGVGYCRTLLM